MWWARIRLLSYIPYFRPRGQTFVRLYHRRLDYNSQAHYGSLSGVAQVDIIWWLCYHHDQPGKLFSRPI